MKYFSILVSSILLVSSCSLFQAPITITITNPSGFNISGQGVTIQYGPFSGDIQGTVYTTASSSGASYSLTGYTPADDFTIIVTLDSANGSSIAGGIVINANTTQDANVILYYNEYNGTAVSGWGAGVLTGGASSGTATFMPNTAVWYVDTLTAGDELWYKLNTIPGSQYAISWDDSFEGSGGATADIRVTVYDSSLSERLESTDGGYNYSRNFVSFGSYVLVKVTGYYPTSAGTFAIGYAPIENVAATRLSNNPDSAKPHFSLKLPKWAKK